MANNRVMNSAANMFYGIANRVIVLVLNFVLRTVMIHTIGVEYLGINGTLSDVLGLLCLADLGIHTAIVYSYYEPIAKDDKEKIIALTTFYRYIYNGIALVILILGLALLPFLDVLIKLDNPVEHLRLYYLLSLGYASGSYLFYSKITVLTAAQKDYVRVKTMLLYNIYRIVLQIALLVVLKSYVVYLIVQLISILLANLKVSRQALKEYPYLNQTATLDRESKISIFSNVKSVFIYKLSNVVLSGTDNTLISMLIGTIYVGYYSNYFLLINSLNNILTIIFNSMTASIGNLVVQEKEEKRYEAYKYMETLSFCLCCITIPCYAILATDFISKVWLNSSCVIGGLSVVAICINSYFSTVYLPIVSYREAVGLYRETRYVMLAAAVANIVLSVLFAQFLGMAGILLATPVARCITYFWYEPKVLFKSYFGRNGISFYKNVILNIMVILIITVACYFTTKCIVVTGLLTWILKACVCVCVSFGIMVLFYHKTDGFKWLVKTVRGLIR